MDLENMLQRIDELLEKGDTESQADIAEIASGAATLFETAYGKHSTQPKQVLELQTQVCLGVGILTTSELIGFKNSLYGCLRTLKSDATEGRLVDFQAEARGEVFGDFIALARRALDEDEKDVAAVLACAALEDSLKQCAKNHGLSVDDKNMTTVMHALKRAGVISGSEGKKLEGFVDVRNDAFHAEWEAINVPHLQTILAYTESFLIDHFSNQPLQ